MKSFEFFPEKEEIFRRQISVLDCQPLTVIDFLESSQAAQSLKRQIGDGFDGLNDRKAVDLVSFGRKNRGASLFNPEKAYALMNLFAPESGRVYDPFAGGGTRGIMSASRGLQYVGQDVRSKQVDAANKRICRLKFDKLAKVIEGDATDAKLPDAYADFSLSCPPYWKKERYSDLQGDLSNAVSYEDFLHKMYLAAKETLRILKPDSFLCWVLGNYRDNSTGILYPIAHDVGFKLREAGFVFHDELILHSRNNGAVRRVGKFAANKRLINVHETALILKKPGVKNKRRRKKNGSSTELGSGQRPYEKPLAIYTQQSLKLNAISVPPIDEASLDKPTPVQEINGIYFKRDDLFEIAGVCGGKARSAYMLIRDAMTNGGVKGLITAGNPDSPQISIVMHLGAALGLPVIGHTRKRRKGLPPVTEELLWGLRANPDAELHVHDVTRDNIVASYPRHDAKKRGWLEIPFGMETDYAVQYTAKQVKDIRDHIKRIVLSVGSGMTLAGVLQGICDQGLDQEPGIEIVAVMVGSDFQKTVDKFIKWDWRKICKIHDVGAEEGIMYAKRVTCEIESGFTLDPIYEAKAYRYARPGDLFWVTGIHKADL